MNVYPVITLYQPWATWIMRKWKTIETRTHDRFKALNNKTILIHAGMSTDKNSVHNPFLTNVQLIENPNEIINGYILGQVFVYDFKKLSATDDYEHKALIECKTERFGLFLCDIVKFNTPIACKGGMGIWYFDLDKMKKVKKTKNGFIEM